MKPLFTSATLAALILSGGANAAIIGGAEVHLLPAPRCAAESLPTKTEGTSYVDVMGPQQFAQGTATDPFHAWPSRRGVSPYNALVGSPGAEADAVYLFDKPQASITFVYGTPGAHERFSGYDATGTRLFEISGPEFLRHFPTPSTQSASSSSYNVKIVPSAPIVEFKIASRDVSTEYGNVQISCK